MKQYYLLELTENIRKIEKSVINVYNNPYYIINLLYKDVDKTKSIYFIITDCEEYLYVFANVKNVREFFEKCDLFYNKGNFISGRIYHNSCSCNMRLSSKNFDNYYSYTSNNSSYELKEYNKLLCEIKYIHGENKEYFSVEVIPLYILSRSNSNKKYIELIDYYRFLYHRTNKIDINEFKNFDTFRELMLHCVELDKKRFEEKYKLYSHKKHYKKIFNEYYNILVDVINGIEL